MQPWGLLVFQAGLSVLFVGAADCQVTTRPQGASGNTSSADKRSLELLAAFRDGNFRLIFDRSSFYQAAIPKIQRENPQIMWPKLNSEYYEAAKADFEGRGWGVRATLGGVVATTQPVESPSNAPNPAGSIIRPLVRGMPRWSILETRANRWERVEGMQVRQYTGTLAYAQLGFESATRAPLYGDGILKEIILALTFESNGNFYEATAQPKSEVLWPGSAGMQILSAQWITVLRGEANLGFNIVGGTPPYSGVLSCGDHRFRVVVRDKSNSFSTGIYGSPFEEPKSHLTADTGGELPNSTFPLECRVTVRDAQGVADAVLFRVPQMYSTVPWGGYCWIRPPWFGWYQGQPRPRHGCVATEELLSAQPEGTTDTRETGRSSPLTIESGTSGAVSGGRSAAGSAIAPAALRTFDLYLFRGSGKDGKQTLRIEDSRITFYGFFRRWDMVRQTRIEEQRAVEFAHSEIKDCTVEHGDTIQIPLERGTTMTIETTRQVGRQQEHLSLLQSACRDILGARDAWVASHPKQEEN